MLTPSAVANAKSKPSAYKLSDGHGLYLLVRPNRSRWWRFDYRRPGSRKRNTLSLGTFPDVSLKQARDQCDAARRLLAEGVDPGARRQALTLASAESFEAVAREWIEKQHAGWTPKHYAKVVGQLERDAFPWIGAQPIKSISAPDVLSVLRRVESRGALDTAHRIQQNIARVFRFSVATGRRTDDPTPVLRGSLATPVTINRAAITDSNEVGALLRAIDTYEGYYPTRAALRLAPMVFLRPGELRNAQWAEINLDGAEWRIPPERMKMRTLHIVPLSRQAIAILRDLQPLTGRGHYVFPSVRSGERPMSDNTLNGALRRLGYEKTVMTAHGFRSMASTILNEQGWRADVIERQLAHAPRDKVRSAYNHAQYLPERRRMMQAWADYLDGLRIAPAKVVAIGRRSGRQA